jgi:hypothetical protein
MVWVSVLQISSYCVEKIKALDDWNIAFSVVLNIMEAFVAIGSIKTRYKLYHCDQLLICKYLPFLKIEHIY